MELLENMERVEFLENIGALGLEKSIKCQNSESSRSGEERVEFVGKTGKVDLGNLGLVKAGESVRSQATCAFVTR